MKLGAFGLVVVALASCGCRSGPSFESMVNEVGHATTSLKKPAEALTIGRLNEVAWTAAATQSGENMMVSPVSLGIILGLLQNGADGKTREELDRLLGSSTPALEPMKAAQTILQYGSKDVKTDVAGLISFGDQPTPLKSFLSEAEGAGFEVQSSGQSVDAWLSKSSNGRFEKSALPDVRGGAIYIASTLSFRGQWEDPFFDGDTKPDPFYTEGGEALPAMMMHKSFHRPYYADADHSAMTVPFGGDRLMMWLALPPKGRPVNELLPKALGKFKSFASNAYEPLVNLSLPRFECASQRSLRTVLSGLGVTSLFDSRAADLKRMSSTPGTYLVDVIQRAHISVDEEGAIVEVVTEGMAGAAGGEAAPTPEVVDFIVNRPFVFSIYDKETQATLLVGVVRRI